MAQNDYEVILPGPAGPTLGIESFSVVDEQLLRPSEPFDVDESTRGEELACRTDRLSVAVSVDSGKNTGR